jgi:hypothetical protein
MKWPWTDACRACVEQFCGLLGPEEDTYIYTHTTPPPPTPPLHTTGPMGITVRPTRLVRGGLPGRDFHRARELQLLLRLVVELFWSRR